MTSLGARRGAPLASASALLALLAGCADPHGQFDDFTEALAKRPPPATGACGEEVVQSVEGTFFAAMATELDRSQPVVALAQVRTDESGMHIILQTLQTADRQTPAGEPIVMPPAAVEESGEFSTELSGAVVPAAANPLLDDDIVMSRIGLAGSVCERVICGDWWGTITAPLALELHAGQSQFAMVRVELGESYPEPPTINCVGELAAPLE